MNDSEIFLVIDQLKRIADAQEKLAVGNAEFQRAIIAAFTPLIPTMLAMFSQSFAMPRAVTVPGQFIGKPDGQ